MSEGGMELVVEGGIYATGLGLCWETKEGNNVTVKERECMYVAGSLM